MDCDDSQVPPGRGSTRTELHCFRLSFVQDARLLKATSNVTGVFIMPCCFDMVFRVAPISEYSAHFSGNSLPTAAEILL